MHRLGIPAAIIEEYLEWVTNLHGMLGPFGIFIASGFKPTWVFNTLDNMAYEALKHQLTPASVRPVARAFSGDDSNHNEKVVERQSFKNSKHRFRLQSKGVHTDMPYFCGTLNTPAGTFAEPTLLLQRVIYKARRGGIYEAALSYAEHCSRLAQNIEGAAQYLSGTQLTFHTLTRRLLRFYLEKQGRGLIGTFFLKLRSGHFDLSY